MNELFEELAAKLLPENDLVTHLDTVQNFRLTLENMYTGGDMTEVLALLDSLTLPTGMTLRDELNEWVLLLTDLNIL
jgi:hypothetical protein